MWPQPEHTLTEPQENIVRAARITHVHTHTHTLFRGSPGSHQPNILFLWLPDTHTRTLPKHRQQDCVAGTNKVKLMFVLRQQVGRCFTVSHHAEHKALNYLVPHRNCFLPPVRTFCSTHSRGHQLPRMHHIKTNLDLSHYTLLLSNHGYTFTPFDRSLHSVRKQNVTGFIWSKGKGEQFLQDIVDFDTSA